MKNSQPLLPCCHSQGFTRTAHHRSCPHLLAGVLDSSAENKVAPTFNYPEVGFSFFRAEKLYSFWRKSSKLDVLPVTRVTKKWDKRINQKLNLYKSIWGGKKTSYKIPLLCVIRYTINSGHSSDCSCPLWPLSPKSTEMTSMTKRFFNQLKSEQTNKPCRV